MPCSLQFTFWFTPLTNLSFFALAIPEIELGFDLILHGDLIRWWTIFVWYASLNCVSGASYQPPIAGATNTYPKQFEYLNYSSDDFGRSQTKILVSNHIFHHIHQVWVCYIANLCQIRTSYYLVYCCYRFHILESSIILQSSIPFSPMFSIY